MSRRVCVLAAEIGDIPNLPDNDPKSVHVRECPRCRALLDSYLAFMSGGNEADADRLVEAENVLRDRIAAEIARTGDVGGSPVPKKRRPETRGLRGVRRALLATAALLLVAVFLYNINEGDEREIRLRGEPKTSEQEWGWGDNRVGADGSLLLSWEPLASADEYAIDLYDTDLELLRRFGPYKKTSATISNDDIVALGSPRIILLRVVARRRGDDVSVSPTWSVALP